MMQTELAVKRSCVGIQHVGGPDKIGPWSLVVYLKLGLLLIALKLQTSLGNVGLSSCVSFLINTVLAGSALSCSSFHVSGLSGVSAMYG
jgi:hypothetical protein